MRIDCLHGYFKFNEVRQGQISAFMSVYDLVLVKDRDFYTFETLKDAPLYAIKDKTYLGATVTQTYEGNPWEILEQNGLVFDFTSDSVVPKASITTRVIITQLDSSYLSEGLILPGSVTDDGKRVINYSAWFFPDTKRFKYSEITFEDA